MENDSNNDYMSASNSKDKKLNRPDLCCITLHAHTHTLTHIHTHTGHISQVKQFKKRLGGGWG